MVLDLECEPRTEEVWSREEDQRGAKNWPYKMLISKNRLRKKNDINNVFKKGKTVTGNFIFLRMAKNNLDINRFAFAVSSKVSKKSVLRNKIKRQLRAIIKKNILKIKPGFDFMLIAKPQIINQRFKEIEKEIDAILNSKFNKII